jgi:P-type Mg2+ transporter
MSTATADATSLSALGRTVAAYWSLDSTELATQLQSTSSGLSGEEAAQRLRKYGPNDVRASRELSRVDVLSRHLRSPLLLLLVFAAGASLIAGEWLDAAIVMIIVIISVAIGYSREYSAQTTAAALRARIRTRCTVVRDGQEEQVSIEDVVPGDLVLLSAGSLCRRMRSSLKAPTSSSAKPY